jgi:hypothetical protein
MSNGNNPTIRIIRAGNGQVRAVPSPAPLESGDDFWIKNWTDCPATVDFTGVPVDPMRASIDPRAAAKFKVRMEAAGYYEYNVTLVCTGKDNKKIEQYAEGGSRPGLIIDP